MCSIMEKEVIRAQESLINLYQETIAQRDELIGLKNERIQMLEEYALGLEKLIEDYKTLLSKPIILQ